MLIHRSAADGKNTENLSTLGQNRWDFRKIKISDFHNNYYKIVKVPEQLQGVTK